MRTLRCPYPLYFSTALRMHTKHCLLRPHVRVHSLTWLAVPARPYCSRSCLLQDYSSFALVSTTLACPVVWSWVTVGTSHGAVDFPELVAASCRHRSPRIFFSLRGILVVNQVTCNSRTVMASEIAALTELLKQQMEASAQREKRMAEILDQTLKAVAVVPQPTLATKAASQQLGPQSAKTVAVDRPMLL